MGVSRWSVFVLVGSVEIVRRVWYEISVLKEGASFALCPHLQSFYQSKTMEKLKQLIAAEQPAINDTLRVMTDELPPMSRPVARHIFMAGGKRVRPLLTLFFGRLNGCKTDEVYRVGCAVEMLHAATLLHDDILDNASLRRGKPTAHTRFNSGLVIMAGDAMLAKAVHVVSAYNDPRLTATLAQAVLETAEGQIAECANIRNVSLSYEDYEAIIRGKTAWLLRTSCEMGAIFAKADDAGITAAGVFGEELGMAFQLVDDAIDFSPASVTGKPSGGDLAEGKMTPPIYFYLNSLEGEEREKFYESFVTNTFTKEELARHSERIGQSEGIAKTRDLAAGHIAKALSALEFMPPSDEKTLLTTMANYIIARAH